MADEDYSGRNALGNTVSYLRGIHGKVREDGLKAPSVRAVASKLGVSVQTVQKAFRSLSEEGLLRGEPGRGSFWRAAGGKIRIGLGFNMLRQTGSPDWKEVSLGVMEAAAHSERSVYVVSLVDSRDNEERRDSILKGIDDVDGLILFPYVDADGRIRRTFEQKKKPVVSFNPDSEISTANFVAPDYYGASYACGKSLRKAGRRCALVILSPEMNMSCSNRMRYSGFCGGFGFGLERDAEVRVVETHNAHSPGGRAALSSAMEKSRWIPDCIYCSGDMLTGGVFEYLAEKKLRVPDDISVVSSSGLHMEKDGILLSTMSQPFKETGEALQRMLEKRIVSAGAAQPGIFLPFGYVEGNSCSAVENKLIKEALGERAEALRGDHE